MFFVLSRLTQKRYVRVHVCLTACFLVSFLSLTLLLLSCFLSSVDFLSFFFDYAFANYTFLIHSHQVPEPFYFVQEFVEMFKTFKVFCFLFKSILLCYFAVTVVFVLLVFINILSFISSCSHRTSVIVFLYFSAKH